MPRLIHTDHSTKPHRPLASGTLASGTLALGTLALGLWHQDWHQRAAGTPEHLQSCHVRPKLCLVAHGHIIQLLAAAHHVWKLHRLHDVMLTHLLGNGMYLLHP